MSEETPVLEEILPDIDPATRAQVDAILSQRMTNFEQQKALIERQVRAEMERKFTEERNRASIAQFAMTATTTTTTQPYAVGMPVGELEQLLLETPVGPRIKWMALLGRMTRGEGLVSFDEIGSSGGAEYESQWDAMVNAKVAAGFSRVDAIKAVAKEHPGLYDAQSRAAKKGGR
jgi:hypothetical protein